VSTIADLVIKLGLKDTASADMEKSSSKLGNTLGLLGKTAAVAAGGAAIGGLFEVIKTGIGEFNDSTKVAAQTTAVLKSTGGAANVTAGQVSNLAGALLNKTGVDDETIQSGENMLLTFTNIRNEAGKGNDVFNQSTKTLLDMSVALGEDAPSAAIQLGKALNDPITGVTALQRVGVTFTAAQKEQIKAMVDAGNTMGAQKLILGELNNEFGGSAEAVGKTLPGQLSILKESFNNLAGQVVGSLMPTMQQAVAWLLSHWTQISATLQAVFNGIGFVIRNVLVPAIEVIATGTEAVVSEVKAHWTQITNVVNTAVSTIKTVIQGGVNAAEAFWTKFGADIERVIKTAFDAIVNWTRQHWSTIQATVSGAVNTIKTVIQTTVAVATAFWNKFGSTIISITKTSFAATFKIIGDVVSIVGSMITAVGDLIHGRWGKLWDDLKNIVSKTFDALTTYLVAEATIVLTAAEAIGKAIGDGIVKGAEGIGDRLKSAVTGEVSKGLGGVKSFLHINSPSKLFMDEVGSPIGEGIVAGASNDLGTSLSAELIKQVKSAAERAQIAADLQAASKVIGTNQADAVAAGFVQQSPSMEAQIKAGLATAIQNAKQAVTDASSNFQSAFSSLAQSALSAFDTQMSTWVPPATKLLDKMQLQDQVTSARAAIKSAQASINSDTGAYSAAAVAVAMATPANGETAADFQTRLAGLKAQAAQTKAQVLSDETGLGQAKRSQVELNLQLEATQQQAAQTKKVAGMREDLAQQLVTLRTELDKQPGEYDTAQAKVMKLLASYNVPLHTAGQKFASELADGLRSQIGDVQDAAKDLAHAVAKYLVTHSPAEAGPLSEASPYDLGARIGNGFNEGLGDSLYAGQGLSGPALSPGAASLGRGSSADGDAVIMVDGQVFGRIARKYLTREGARNAGLSFN
jgi:phage-related protein